MTEKSSDVSRTGLSRESFPETVFIPAVQVDLSAMGLGTGTIDISLLESEGKLAVPVWRTAQAAIAWLQNGGYALLKAPSQGQFDQYVHLEPDLGSLFSPPERRIKSGT
jgi:hypothetical protein